MDSGVRKTENNLYNRITISSSLVLWQVSSLPSDVSLERQPALLYASGTVAQIPRPGWVPGRTLALHMYVLSSEGLHMNQASATAVVILLFVLIINGLCGMVAKRMCERIKKT